MRKRYIFIIIFHLLIQFTFAQIEEYRVNLNLTGKKYERIILKIFAEPKSLEFEGLSSDGYKWVFAYPDSIYEKHKDMDLRIPENNDSVFHSITFSILKDRCDTLKLGGFTFKAKEATVNALFYKTEIKENVTFFRGKDYHNDIFFVSKNDDPDLYIKAQAMKNGYSMFERSLDTLNLSYDERLNNYVSFTKQHPNSQFLISHLASTLTFYKTKNDIEKVFDSFSDKNKQSYFGKKIHKYLTTNYFENSFLPSWNTKKLEPIIQDTTKYTLVIFSASWCGPCHKQIPLLKEIYSDLHDKLDIVYVSIDELETVDGWSSLMEKENIPWRSVLAVNEIKKIKEKYTVQTIPLSLLVHPNSYIETVDIREEKQKERLYHQVKQ